MSRMVLVLTLSLVTMVGPAFSQADEPADDRIRFEAAVNFVHLSVSVVNKKGKLVSGLDEKDFRVLEDDRIQEIAYFSQGEDSPVDFILLVDASGSMDVTTKAANARNAAIQLIHRLGPEDRVSVYAFDKDLYRITELTDSKEVAIDSLTKLEPFGSTALYDAVATLATVVVHEGFGRRAIIVVTDGFDTSSEVSIEEAVAMAKGVDLPVYAIRVLSPVDDPKNDLFLGVHGAVFRGEDALEQFTTETGGAMFEGSQWGQLSQATARIREELKTQYRIGYVPQNPRTDGGFRRIDVSTRRRGVEVRTRQGYYPKGTAESEPSSSSNPQY